MFFIWFFLLVGPVWAHRQTQAIEMIYTQSHTKCYRMKSFTVDFLIFRKGVYYLSIAGAGFLCLIIALAIIRFVFFCLLWCLTMGRHHFWLLPNLTEDVGFFASFWPLYHYEYKGVEIKEPKTKKKKKDKDSDNEQEDDKPEEETVPQPEPDAEATE